MLLTLLQSGLTLKFSGLRLEKQPTDRGDIAAICETVH
jgi:hypothetical protein